MKPIKDIQVLHLGIQAMNNYLDTSLNIQFNVEENELQWVEGDKVIHRGVDVFDAYIKNFNEFWEHFDAEDIQHMNELSFLFARDEKERSFGMFFHMFPQV